MVKVRFLLKFDDKFELQIGAIFIRINLFYLWYTRTSF